MTTEKLLLIYKELNERTDRPECYEKLTEILLDILEILKKRVSKGGVY